METQLAVVSKDQQKFRGETRFDGVGESRALRTRITEEVNRWLTKKDLMGLGSNIVYKAIFERNGPGHLLACQVAVIDGIFCLWASSGTGASPEEALKNCLYSPCIEPKTLIDAGSVSA
jgi:hypothetical protein